MGEELFYGPERPRENYDYDRFSTPEYLTGHARKILMDLVRVARMYNGRLIRIYVPDPSERCPECTNLITGERLLTICPRCQGTGFVRGYRKVGEFWSYVDFGPGYRVGTDFGNSENPNGTKESVIILGAPMLYDGTVFFYDESKEGAKIYNIEPHVIAMRGAVIAQIAQVSRITPGSEEYKLIDW